MDVMYSRRRCVPIEAHGLDNDQYLSSHRVTIVYLMQYINCYLSNYNYKTSLK